MRIIAMGGQALIDGFALLGCETHANATPDDVERVLLELLRRKEKAILFLEESISRGGGPNLERVRSEGGDIVISEIPPLRAPEDYHPPVEELVTRILGPSALEEKA